MDLCEGFVKHGHKVTVITTPHPEGEKVETQSGFTVHYLTQSRPKKLSGAWFKESRNLVDEIHQNTPIDVIHSNAGTVLSPASTSGFPKSPSPTNAHLRVYSHECSDGRR